MSSTGGAQKTLVKLLLSVWDSMVKLFLNTRVLVYNISLCKHYLAYCY